MQPKQARGQQTLDRIRAACDSLLQTQSFEQISIQDIAREAGVSVGNVYNRFMNKEALINDVVASHQLRARDAIEQGLNSVRAKTLKSRLTRMTVVMAGAIEPLRPVFVTLAARQASELETLSDDIKGNTNTLIDSITTWLLALEPSLSPERTRFAVSSIAFGLQYNLIFQTPARLFGKKYVTHLSDQAYAYLSSDNIGERL
jgi:AcrR family transcriptional regulator